MNFLRNLFKNDFYLVNGNNRVAFKELYIAIQNYNEIEFELKKSKELNTTQLKQIIQLKNEKEMLLQEINRLKSSTVTVPVQLLAFPTAVGLASTTTTGGRSGNVIHVTNLNDSGAGSLREALTTSGTRTIVFDISGVINLLSDIIVSDGDFTIAGQTTPLGGITIIGTNVIRMDCDNFISRYIRFRSSYDDSNVDGGFVNTNPVNNRNANNFIYDHCSSALGTETSGFGGGLNDNSGTLVNSISNNLIVETARGSIMGDSNDGSPFTGTYYRNGHINVGWRLPNVAGTADIDIVNNYSYNWQGRTIRANAYDHKINMINNTYEAGNITRLSDNDEILFTIYTNDTMNPQIWDEGTLILPYTYNGGASTYDPTPVGYPADKSLAWDPFYGSTDPIKSEWFVNSRLPMNGDINNIWASVDVKTNVLNNSGANKYIDDNGEVQTYRDVIDSQGVDIAKGLRTNYVVDGVTYDLSDGTHLPESNYKTIALALENETPSNTRPVDFYQSNPHIPESYLTRRGITGSADIHNTVMSSGYTLLEEYINQVDE